ncbi:MAG: Crp/Fnr family transcriptional regulator [Saprospiraceae bacterium]|nr:Crp/Fnr family transcriptional regulator [Pyrinomonadaceae bacterium]
MQLSKSIRNYERADSFPLKNYDWRNGNDVNAKSDQSCTANLLMRSLFKHAGKNLSIPMNQTVLTKGDFLYQQDDEIDHVYFPETAAISEFRLLEDGRMVEIAITGREGALGIPSLFGPCLASNIAGVSHTGTALKIATGSIKRQISADAGLMLLMYDWMNKYIRQISQKAICNMYHSVETRFCTWLLMLQDRTSRSVLKLTHEEIARILGVYRPSVTYIALELRKQNLIDYSRGGISISDRAGLKKHACDCYAELAADYAEADSVRITEKAGAFRTNVYAY